MPSGRDGGIEPTAELSEQAGSDPTVAATVPDLHGEPLPVSPGTRPAKLGRFTLLGELGRGGMGVVHAAYDDRLDRKVAIKVLRVGVHDVGGEGLLREAQAMAKLSHPNVVQVYEVGEDRGRLFIAMEFVDGGSLREWMQAGPHPWRDVLKKFAQAGRGLAAAHERGLVHFDFKPDNVLLDRKGRARITDFGLTKVTSSEETTLEDADTRVTSIRGTPAFMAPEQWKGLVGDARSDQYAFCVALHEALWGTRPFTGKSVAALEIAVLDGDLTPVEDNRGVPDRIRSAILRGLSLAPGDRWPSMAHLLREITRDRWKVMRPWIAATAAGLGLGLGVMLIGVDDDRCENASSAMDGTWDAARRADVEDAFSRSTRPFARQASDRVVHTLDAFATQWSAMRVEACEATWERGEQSEATLDLRMMCLDRQREQVGAFVDRFAAADDTVVDSARDAVEKLPHVESCADVEALRAAHPPPPPEQVAMVAAVERKIDEADATYATGHFGEGKSLAEQAYNEAVELAYPPTAARAGNLWGRYLNEDERGHDAQEVLLATLKFAAAAGDPQVEVEVWANLIFAVTTESVDLERGLQIAFAAEVAIERLEEPRPARALLATHLAGLHSLRGDHDAANEQIEKAIAIHEELGAAQWGLATALATQAGILVNQGRNDDALEVAQRARALAVVEAGEMHPSVFAIDHNIAVAHLQASRYEEAAARFEELIARRERVQGSKHPALIDNLGSLSGARYMQGRHEEAATLLERASAIAAEVLPPNDPTHGRLAIGLAGLLKDSGQAERAAALYAKAYADLKVAMGSDNPLTLAALNGMGLLEMERGNYADAVKHLRAANAAFDPDEPERARTLLGLADTLAALGQPEEGMEAIDEGLELMRKQGNDNQLVPYALCSKARLLTGQRDYEGAREAYTEAMKHYERSLGPDAAALGIPLLGLGHIAVVQGRDQEAIPLLERAVAVTDGGGLGQMMRLDARLALAVALSADRSQYRRARELVEDARLALPEDHIKRKQADAFLASLED